jgi:lysine 2,3-aminomutase
VCPVYCRYCTRSYSIGVDTASVSKVRFLPIMKRWEPIFEYIERTTTLNDILVSGGDGYSLSPEQLLAIGRRLLSLPHILRLRFASKGLAVCPSRLVDPEDQWAEALIQLSKEGRAIGKNVSLHTHFNHPNEITWITEAASRRLFEEGVQVRNQTVLLNGVNSDVETMTKLIRRLAALNIQPVSQKLSSDVLNVFQPLIQNTRTESQVKGIIYTDKAATSITYSSTI